MGFKKIFLQLPISLQLHIGFILIILIFTIFILFVINTFLVIYNKFLFISQKEYFYNLEQNIIESNIYFQNLCLLQYEGLIKFFNYQFYFYLLNENNLIIFANNYHFNHNKTILLTPQINKITPEYNASISEEEQKIYVYCYLDNSRICKLAYRIIYENSMPFYYQFKAARDFRIAFYGDYQLLGEYILAFTKYNILYSFNITSIREMIKKGNINNAIYERSEITYNYFKQFFYDFENNKLNFFDIMYKLRYNIFSDCLKIKDISKRESYIKDKSIYFQTIHFANDTTRFYNNWDYKISKFTGKSRIINGYIDFLFFLLLSKLNMITIPINHETNTILSKNLCYCFIRKQIIYLNIISEKKNKLIDEKLMDDIYNIIFNKDILSIEDCKLEKYYTKIIEEIPSTNTEFFNYYDLESNLNIFFHLINKNDKYSHIFGMKFSYPNFINLKDFSSYFFSFQQLDFFSFYFGISITKIIGESKYFFDKMRYFIMLILFYIWLIFFIIFRQILLYTIKQITNPIIKLNDVVQNKFIKEKMDNIFEYKLDENINDFFILFKNLIEGKIKENENRLKINKKLDNNSKRNNNLIINHKMINELIENQKSLNNNDKEIFLLEHQRYISDKMSKKIRETNSMKFMSINLKKINDNNLISNSSNEENSNNKDIDINTDVNNIGLYKNLLLITEFLYNKYNNNKNYLRLISNNRVSINNENNLDNNKININCKYITFYWYMKAKKNNNFESFDEI